MKTTSHKNSHKRKLVEDIKGSLSNKRNRRSDDFGWKIGRRKKVFFLYFFTDAVRPTIWLYVLCRRVLHLYMKYSEYVIVYARAVIVHQTNISYTNWVPVCKACIITHMVGEPRQLYLPSIPYSLIDMHSYKENKEYKLISIFLSIDKWLFIKSIEYQIEILFMKYIIFSVWGVWNENLVHGEGKKI